MTSLDDLLPVLAELNARRSDEAPLVEVARRAAQSPGHAQRTFTRLVGESPKRYQRRLRLEAAAVLLATGDLPVIDVALTVGFGSHEGFTRAFGQHYGMSPFAYRRRRRGDWSSAAGLVHRVGPCVALYRASTDPPIRGVIMSYDIVVKTLPETPMLASRRHLDVAEMATVLAEALPAVYAYVMEQGLAMAGPPFVRHLDQSPAFVTIEAGIPLVEPAPSPTDRDDIEAGTLPGGEAATTIHTGPYDQLGDAYAALDRWLTANDRQPAGHPWEVYVTDPGEVPDPADWQTEVIWPVQPASS